jgi:hypothetical protein
MRSFKLAAALVTAAVSCSAFSQTTATPAKSRAEVQQELVKAQHDGVIPINKTQYPPNEEQKARNKGVHAASVHRGEQAPNLDQHDPSVKAK